MGNYRIITSSEKIDKKKWGDFVFNHPLGNIYQTPHIFNVYHKTKYYEPILITAFDKEEISGILLAVIMKEEGKLKESLSSRAIILGGPLAKSNDPAIISAMLEEYDSLIKKNVIYSEIREIYDLPFKNIFYINGYTNEDRLNIIIDLGKEVEVLWREMDGKRRNEIRRAEKEGTVVKELNSASEVSESYKILKEVYSRAKLPIADESLFTNCFEYLHPKKMIKYFGAFNAGKLIGTMYVLCYKDRVIDWYAGSYQDYYHKYPNDLIPWEVFKYFKNDGYKVFDFGGAGKPNVPYGVRDYKKKFGGEFIQLVRYQCIHKSFLMNVAKLGLNIWQKLK